MIDPQVSPPLPALLRFSCDGDLGAAGSTGEGSARGPRRV